MRLFTDVFNNMHYLKTVLGIDLSYYLISFLLGTVVYGICRARSQHISFCLAAAMSVAYMVVVLSITVFSRGPTDHDFNYFPPLWAYKAIMGGHPDSKGLLVQIIVNIFMLVPLGFMLPFVNRKYPILIGIVCSLLVESMQYITKRGYFEIDDIVHNTIGILIGYLAYKVFSNIKMRVKKSES